MSIPDFQTLMLPILRDLEHGERTTQQTVDAMSDLFGLSDEERAQLLPSGRQSVIRNRIAWAKTHMKAAKLVRSPSRGVYALDDRGRDLLKENPSRVDMAVLWQFAEYRAFRGIDVAEALTIGTSAPILTDTTPEALIERGLLERKKAVTLELLEQVKASSPAEFEEIVIDVLRAMGYGIDANAAKVVGGSGDAGIDGVIREDHLGLSMIYVQAKKWEGSVGRPEIQRFAGALAGQKAVKGVFITTSAFTADARAFAASITARIALVDGATLADLMYEHNVGVAVEKTVQLKRLDSDYFVEA